ncbi:MAG: hypothetical protein ACRER2_16935 [Methylococcales bacterium]
MTTVQITLPDQLVDEAQRAGLLSPEAIENLGACPRIAIVARARLIEPDFSII